jgi:hypothetical protein
MILDAQRPRCAALKEARSAAAQASVTNALLGGNVISIPFREPVHIAG